MAQQLCRRNGCTCAARSDGFCSEYCAGDIAAGGDEGHPCACGHDECRAPTKGESWDAVAKLAPEGRSGQGYTPRDW